MAIGVTEKENSGMGLGSSSRAVLKRKQPAKIYIPMASLNFEVDSPRLDVMEVEDDGYSVYCKRERRGRGCLEC